MTKNALLLALLGGLGLLAIGAAEAGSRPNILFIFSDDHSPQAIGAYDGWLAGLDPTPNIDRLAEQGVLFRNSFCTNSICGPSRAVVLTGRHSHLNGFLKNGQRFDPTQWVFPRELQRVGYQTAIVGKWHLGCDPEGFDYWRVLPGQGAYYNPAFRSPRGKKVIKGHCTEIVTDLAIDWLTNRDPDKPFLLMCQHKAPHRTWMPAPEHLTLYEDEVITEPPTLFDDLADNASPALASEMSIREDLHPNYDLFLDVEPTAIEEASPATDRSGQRNLPRMSKRQLADWNAAFADGNAAFREAAPTGDERVRAKHQRYVKNYLRAVRGVDDSVGRLVERLDELGLADNTIVVYSSDQGFYLGEHGWYDKRWMYEPSLAMPLVIRWPGVAPAGKVVDAMVQNLDYAPTLLDAAGVEAPAELQGRSMKPLLAGDSPNDWRRSIYYHYHGYPATHSVARHNGVRTDRYKLIHFYQTDEWELYDLEADPDEVANLYGDLAYETIAVELKTELARLVAEYADTTDTSPLADAN